MRQGVDFRGDGGYVILPPTVHRSGRTYEWEAMHSIVSMNIASIPQWLSALVGNERRHQRANPSSYWSDILSNISEGKRNTSLTKIMGHLMQRHVDPHLASATLNSLNKLYCTPPLEIGEVQAIAESITARELLRRAGKK